MSSMQNIGFVFDVELGHKKMLVNERESLALLGLNMLSG